MELTTGRLVLRAHAPCDFDRFWDMLNDPVAKKYTGGVTKLTRGERLHLFLEDCAVPFSSGGAELAVVRAADGAYLGYCGFRRGGGMDGPELFYGLCRDCWGLGVGYEAAAAALPFFRSLAPGEAFYATADAENAASVKILKKLGFAAAGELDGAELYVLEPEVRL